jgi:hypothetical protein
LPPEFRPEAAKLRRDAEWMIKDRSIKREILEVAAQYERLAESIEEARSPDKP